MPVTPQQIAAATTALELQRLQTTLQAESAADQADTNAKYEADMAARAQREVDRDVRYFAELDAAAQHRADVLAVQREMLAVQKRVEAGLMSPRGELYLGLYRFHFEQRKSALNTATTDATLQDIVRDAVLMTDAAMLALEPKVLP